MIATYYNERAEVRVGDLPQPKLLNPGDAIVRVTLAGICGADLEFTQNGPEVGYKPGMRTGHEFVGVVEEVGKDVTVVKPGDRVVASAGFVDGECFYCKLGQYPACEHFGLFGSPMFLEHGGEDVQGGQSEFVRVPYANGTLFKLPESLSGGADDTRVLPLGDNFSTGFHGAVNARIQPGETVVVFGDGAVGLSTVMAATLFGPAAIVLIGRHDCRLELGNKAGATHVLNANNADAVAYVKEQTDGRGAASVIDTIGGRSSLTQTLEVARAGASISVTGLGHLFAPVDAPYSAAAFRNLHIHTGIVTVNTYVNRLLPLVESGRIDPSIIFTDILPLAEAVRGYALMRDRSAGTVKVALRNC
ncbi:Threonine dehydrogenase [Acidisarcina polymorpha]|uniref:Threonine dehydrogenase n=1 Tax=Acidisarcina polymorpha TaxID=2211140 RepID=A0A2Z5G4A2_9BACT|nr:alcohol dehydrogenase catalytic domain-containing protein [Acidisarcina polymorpha]AXC13938.1 Threonine dehydrogenase [Acidisarcina polymorpha]